MTPEGTTEETVRPKPEKPRLRPNEDPEFYAALGRAIKVGRTQLGLERKDLAERANVSYAYLSDIETGRGRPSSRSLLKVAEALGRTASELLQEAEAYHQLSGLDEEDVAGSPWFHELRQDAGVMARSVSPSPSMREFRDTWRAKLATSEAGQREELRELVGELPLEDVVTLLALAKRLRGSPEAE